MNIEFEIHYHGTTTDRLEPIAGEGTKPMLRPETGIAGAWTTRILENSVKHAIKRAEQRGGLMPVVLQFRLPRTWVQEHNDRTIVDGFGYDENVHCFTTAIPQEFLEDYIYPQE